MKKSLLISLTALAILGVTTATTLYAQTTTGSSVIARMKAAAAAFTLTADLNPGQTGLSSAPLVGKKTGDILTAGEYNRLLELISEGNGTGGSLQISFKKDYSKDGNSTVPATENIGSHDFCALTRYGEGQTSDSTAGYCKVEKGTDGTWAVSIQALNNNINCQVTCLKGGNSLNSAPTSYNGSFTGLIGNDTTTHSIDTGINSTIHTNAVIMYRGTITGGSHEGRFILTTRSTGGKWFADISSPNGYNDQGSQVYFTVMAW